MKIIGLVPFKNEEWIFATCLASLKPICDEIVCIDDGSTDKSKEIALNYGCKIYDNDQLTNVYCAEHHMRTNLVQIGREMGGTHFICLDADEALSTPFAANAKQILQSLQPGQKISMQWLALWKSLSAYRNDKSIWSNLFKDFIFCDNGNMKYDYKYFHVDRTPGLTTQINTKHLPIEAGAVLHYQFSDWDRYQTKQCDYRCCELIKYPNTEPAINNKYSITLPDHNVILKDMPIDWFITYPRPNMKMKDWRWARMIQHFDEYGIEFFEKLDIWHYEPLLKEFVRRTGRSPRL